VRPRLGRDGYLSQVACQRRAGFTLVELLTVIIILAILASCLAVALGKARALARQADCKSNLRNLGAAILIYRSDYQGRNPDWLSCLYPNYVDDLHIFVCRSDGNHGRGVSRPPTIDPLTNENGVYDSAQVDDNDHNPFNSTCGRNIDVHACSYFYEFSKAVSPWDAPDTNGNGVKEWREYKENQLLVGDAANGGGIAHPKSYSTSRMPIIRCYHHASEGRIRGFANQAALNTRGTASPQLTSERITINVAYAGNVYVGPLWWEGALQPGEQ
jgi:prepilin-type N-terminal cleavage/methylation domain-containing protein